MGNFIADTFNNLLEMIKPIKEIASSLFGGKSPEPLQVQEQKAEM